ncbi:MAG: zinc-binding alcohol dehydrogenase [Candidatus Latescibacteria bacterium]|nr:zinc-binding alcohol dehydrogenase [Candidatus Latescibacterota bacterium]
MPRELIALDWSHFVLREYEDPPLGPTQMRIRSEFSSPKHGTELRGYRIKPRPGRWDRELGLFLSDEESRPRFPGSLGNTTVGVITEIGNEVSAFQVGDRVFGYFPIRETHIADERIPYPQFGGVRRLPDGMTAEEAACVDPTVYALTAVRDANIRVGDRVAVFGMGAIGLIALHLSKRAGAFFAAAVDPVGIRRDVAGQHGADLVIDPTKADAGLEIKLATDRKGVDVAIEASASYAGFHDAIRCLHFGGLLVSLAYYEGEARGLYLSDEWHRNRITVRSARADSDPNRDHPMWDRRRLWDSAFRLLAEKSIHVEGILQPIVSFEESAEAYRKISESSEGSVKLGVVYE